MSSSSNFDLAVVLGFGAGLFWFFKGFRVYREYRVLADTPEIPIRSIPMGLVEIHGKAKGEQIVTSPVTKTPCLFYKVDIERWVKDKDGGHWAHAKTDADGVKFYLEDGTGKVLVDAHGAEYDLLQTAKLETGRGLGRSLGRALWGKGDPALTTGAAATDAELFAYAQSMVSRGGFSFSLDAGSLLGNLASGAVSLGGGGSDRYRLTEYLIVPEHWYDLTGTCMENPNPKDEHDRNLITKGQNEPTFLISWRSEKEIESALRRRAALHIFGGAALSVVCLAILLARLGWL
jgi:hypothetical protein